MPGQSIQLNGKPHLVAGTISVSELLDSLGLAGKPVVVELNETALPASAHSTSIVKPGASVEVVILSAGG